MLDKIITKNITSLLLIKIATYIIPLVSLPYLVRTLGIQEYGKLAFALAILQYFVLIVNYGFDLSATQKIAKEKDSKEIVSQIFADTIFAKLVLLVLTVIIFSSISLLFKENGNIKNLMTYGYVVVFGSALYPQWLFQGKEQLGLISIMRIVSQLLSLPLLFFFVKEPQDSCFAALIQGMPTLFIAMFAFLLIWKREWLTLKRPCFVGIVKEIKSGFHLFISSASVSIYTTSITVVLGFMSGPSTVALYSAAQKIVQAAQGIYSPISNSFYPRVNKLVDTDVNLAKRMILFVFKIQAFITVCIALLLYVASERIIPLVFGDELFDSILTLKILSVVPIVVGISNILGVQILIPLGFSKAFSKNIVYSSIFSIILLIPMCYFWGENGAAITVVVTEFFVLLLMLFSVIKLTDFIKVT